MVVDQWRRGIDLDEAANTHFQKIYKTRLDIESVVVLFKRFKDSTVRREQDIFACMVHDLFGEHRLISQIPLGMALRYVLEASKTEPESIRYVEQCLQESSLSADGNRAAGGGASTRTSSRRAS